MESARLRRAAGLIGLLGALLFFVGDMLFYGHLGPGDRFASGMLLTVQQASVERLFAGGLLGPLAACLCIVGFWHVYLNVQPRSQSLGRLMFGSFCVLMVAGSAIHALWTARGLAMKFCSGQPAPCASVLDAIREYWTLAYDLGAIPGYLGAVLLAYLVLSKKTWYPRWTFIANPAVWVLLSPFVAAVPAPLGAILVGGSTNLSIAVFFLVSVLTTWSRSADRAGPNLHTG
jgi:hypothetical protein